MDNEAVESLSAEDQAYFSSRGETEFKPETPPTVEVDPEVEADLVEDTDVQAEIEGQQPKKLVPLAALTKERSAAKEVKAKLIDIEKRHAVLEDRWNTLLALNERPAEAKVDEDPMPDREQDIFAFTAWQQRQLDKLTAKVTERETTETQAKQEQERETAVWNFWHQSAQTYKAENADFDEAVKWMSETRSKQLSTLKKLNPQFQTEAGIVQQINAELKDIVVAAAQSNVSPAEYIYEMAKEWGYTPKAAQQTTEDAVAALTKTEEAIAASASLSSAGGSRPAAALDAKAIADMSPNEFEAWYAKNGEAKFRKMAGG